MAAKQKALRIGILTGGGDCPGLNAVIRAVTRAAISQLGAEIIGIEDGYLGLIRNRMRPLSSDDVSNILTQGGTILGTSNKANPAHFMVGEDDNGRPMFEDVTNRVLEHVAENALDVLVAIGGDGTMSGAANLIRRGVRVIGVPKTIDNDLMHSELTFGFVTAVQTAAEALDRIHATASSHHRIMLVEVMGRNAGWLALSAGLASGADIILLPEVPYTLDAIVEACERRMAKGRRFTLMCVAEGAAPQGGKQVVDKVVHDSPEPIRLGGVSVVLARQIAERTGHETRATVLGHVQRGGTPAAFDRVLATQFGFKAVQLIAEQAWGQLAVFREGRIEAVPIESVADQQRLVPLDHPLVACARSLGTSLGDC